MFGIILISISTFFEEISNAIGKNKVARHEESPYTMVFLSIFWMLVFFIGIAMVKPNSFVFSLASLPTFSARIIAEALQWYVYVIAIAKADRTTFSFVRTITIPLLLLVDVILGYHIGVVSVIGIVIIFVAILASFANGGLNKKGISFVLLSAVGAVVTTSLLKYNITHYNSVVAEQLCISVILLVVFFLLALFKSKENSFKFLIKRGFFVQSITIGVSGLIESFAYNYGIASVIVTAKRAFGILWSLLTGKMYFREKHILFKIGIMVIVIVGLICLLQK